MAQEIYMVILVVDDIARSVEFYRRLGLDIPDENVQPHVARALMFDGKMTLLLNDRRANNNWDPDNTDEPSGGYRSINEFYLGAREAVDPKYAEMVAYGYASKRAPFDTTFGARFALIYDPDGNTVLISGE